MTKNIEKNFVQIKTVSFEWGKITELVAEDEYWVKKYEIEPDKFANIDICKGHYVVTSGAAEFVLPEKTQKLFKGEKISLNNLEKIQVKNCGMIVLVIIETCFD